MPRIHKDQYIRLKFEEFLLKNNLSSAREEEGYYHRRVQDMWVTYKSAARVVEEMLGDIAPLEVENKILREALAKRDGCGVLITPERLTELTLAEKRWLAVESADSVTTLRIHNSTPSLRASIVDASISAHVDSDN